MLRRIFLVLLSLLMIFTVSACGSKVSTEKRTVSVWVLSDDYADYIDWTCQSYCSDKEWQADIKVVDGGNFPALIEDSVCKGEIPDIIMMPPESIGYMAENGSLMPFSEAGIRIDESRYYDFAIETGKVKGKLYSMCWHASPGLYVYRKSIASAYLGTDDPAAIESMIADHESFLSVAQLIKASSQGNTYILAGVSDISRPYLCGNLGDISRDEVTDYLTFAKTLSDEGYVFGADQWSDAWVAGFNDSSTIFSYYLSDIAVNDVMFRVCSESAGDWAAAVPYAPYSWGGAYLGIYSGSDNISDAAELIEILTVNESLMTKTSLYSGIFSANIAVNHAVSGDARFQSAVFGGQNYFDVLIKAADKMGENGVQSGNDYVALSLLNTCAENYISGEYDIDAAVETFFSSLNSYIG